MTKEITTEETITAKAITKYVRISQKKARLVAALIRKLPIEEAIFQLSHCGLKAGRLLMKTLTSAIANAEGKDLRRENLVVKEVRIDGGSTAKRVQPANKGRRHQIKKRTSHLSIVVGEE